MADFTPFFKSPQPQNSSLVARDLSLARYEGQAQGLSDWAESASKLSSVKNGKISISFVCVFTQFLYRFI
jgi:hypothetical protein